MVLPVLLTLVLSHARGPLNLVSDVLLFLLLVVVVALVGGFVPAMLAAVGGSMLLNYYFAPPLHTFTIRETNNALAIGVFILVAALVSSVVDLAARRTREAARAKAEAETLGTLAGSILRGETALSAVLERVRETFGLTSVTLLERHPPSAPGRRGCPGSGRRLERGRRRWTERLCAPGGCRHGGGGRRHPDARAAEGDRCVPRTNAWSARSRPRPPSLLERHRLSEAAAAAVPIAEGDKMRTALLAAVGHDLRTPLASVKAAVTSLRSDDIEWSASGPARAAAHCRRVPGPVDPPGGQPAGHEPAAGRGPVGDHPSDRSGRAGAARPRRPRSRRDRGVVVDVPDDLPMLLADPGLLERVIANLVGNALRYSPPDEPPRVMGSSLGERVELRVIDRGPGIPVADLDRVFAPFQRLGDTDNTTGVGLGLALSRGLTEAMGGLLSAEETPGGGLTMVLSMPVAPSQQSSSGSPLGLREREDASAQATPPKEVR